MPAKGSTLRYGNRDTIFNEKVWQSLVENEKITFSYKECLKLITACNDNIADVIVEENDGFKLPLGLGYLCATRFIPKKAAINWKGTTDNDGKLVYYNNLATLGYSVCVKWFRVGRVTRSSFNEIFKFKACKKLATKVSKKFKAGKRYGELTNADFVEKSRLENLYSKKFRKELNEE